MSIIDERIVQMEFDNSDFEQNAQQSMSTLDKLKAKLHIDDDTTPIQAIGYALGDLATTGFGGVSNAVDTVSFKFNSLEIMAIRVLSNIADSAYNAGVRMVKSLSVDQISAGWDKFNKKTTSVGTLIAQGYDMKEVDEQLERLNWFTDETSYNFTDMVNEIGKFTASGQKLDDSVTAMEGIALWAALSGQNAATASRAMYQLSQAMSAKVIKRQDWQSIQSANMDTAEFRQKALDAAEALNTVRKNADGTYRSLKSNSKKVKNFSAKTNFVDSLTEGLWFTDDVLMTVLKDYSGAVEDIYKAVEEGRYDTASEAIDDMGGELDAFQVKAFKAGQEARTLTDVIDSVKDAVSTNWMTTWERIFGNYEEATKFWTKLANEMWDVFAAGGQERNEMLAQWVKLGGRDSALNSFWNIWKGLVETIGTVKDSFHDIFPQINAYKLKDITDNIEEFTSKIGAFYDRLKMYKELRDKDIFTSEDRDNKVKQIDSTIKTLQDARDALWNADYTSHPEKLEKAREDIEKLDKRIEDLKKHREEVIKSINLQGDLMSDTELNNFYKIYSILTGIFSMGKIAGDVIGTLFSLVKTLVTAIFPSTKSIFDLGASFGEWANNLRETLEENQTFETFLDKWSPKVEKFGKMIGKAIEFITGLVRPLLDFLHPVFDILGKGLKKVGDFLEWFFGITDDNKDFNDDISRFADNTGKLGEIIDEKLSPAEKIIKAVTEQFQKLKDAFSGKGSGENGEQVGFFEKTVGIFGKLWGNLQEIFTSAAPVLDILGKALGTAWDTVHEIIINLLNDLDVSKGLDIVQGGIFGMIGAKIIEFFMNPKIGMIKQILGDMGSTLADFLENIRWAISTDMTSKSLLTLAKAIGILAVSLIFLSAVPAENLASAVFALGALGAVLVGVMKGMMGIVPAVELISKGGFMEKIFGKTMKSNQILIISAAVVVMATALLMLAGAVKSLAKLTPDQALIGVLSLFAIIEMMIHTVKKLSSEKKEKMVGGLMGLMAIANAVKILAKPIVEIGQLKVGQAAVGVASVLALMYALAKFAQNTKKFKFDSGIGMIGLATSLILVTAAIKKLGELKPESYVKGLFGFMIVLVAIWKFIEGLDNATTKDSKEMLSLAGGLVLIGIALNAVVSSIRSLGKMDAKSFEIGILGFIIVLAALFEFVNGMLTITQKGADRLWTISGSLILMGVALNVVALAVKSLGDLGPTGMFVSLIALGGALTMLVTAVSALQEIKGGIKELMLLSLVLIPFALGMKILGSIPLIGVAAGILAIFGAFTALGFAAKLLKPLIPDIITLSGSLLPLAGSIALIGVGLVGFALAVKALTDNVRAADAIPTIIALLIGITVFAGMATAISALIGPMLGLAGAIALLTVGLLGLALVFKVFGVESAVNLIIEFLNGVASMLPQIIEAGINVIISFFSGIAQGIIDHAPALADAFLDAIGAILYAVAVFLKEAVLHIFGWLGDFFSWAYNGLQKLGIFSAKAAEEYDASFDNIDTAGKISADVQQAQFATDGLGNVYEVYTNTADQVDHSFDNVDTATPMKNNLENTVSGMRSQGSSFFDATSYLGDQADQGFKHWFGNFFNTGVGGGNSYFSGFYHTDPTPAEYLPQRAIELIQMYGGEYFLLGQNAAEGYANGIWDKIDLAQFAADAMGKHTIAALQHAQISYSPSRLTMKLGNYFGDGYIKGIEDRTDQAGKASGGLANKALKSMRNALGHVSDILGSDLDNAPTIRPVLDLSDVDRGMGTIDNMFGSRSLALAGINGGLFDANSAYANQMATNANSDVVGELGRLRSDVTTLSDNMSKMQVVMDSGTLVGEMVNPMNKRFGQMVNNRRRGI